MIGGRKWRDGLWLMCVVVSIGCGGAGQVMGPSPLPTPANNPPPVSGVLHTYGFARSLHHPVSDSTARSTIVLDDAGRFAVRFDTCCAGGYAGRYAEENGRLRFTFADDDRWEAVGTRSDDVLEIRYNVVMSLSGFEDAVYRRVR